MSMDCDIVQKARKGPPCWERGLEENWVVNSELHEKRQNRLITLISTLDLEASYM